MENRPSVGEVPDVERQALAAALAERDQARAEIQRMAQSKFWRLGLWYWRVRALGLGALRRLLGLAEPHTAPAPQAAPEPEPEPATQPRLPDILCFSTTEWALPAQPPQQRMARFAAQGQRVFYIGPAQSLPAKAAPSFGVRRLAENVFELSLPVQSALDIAGAVIGPSQRATMLGGLELLRETFAIFEAVAYVTAAPWERLALEAQERWGWRLAYDCGDEGDSVAGLGREALALEMQRLEASDLPPAAGDQPA